MNVSLFISRKIKFKSRLAITSIAVSFFVMIISVAISSGFRSAVREGISSVSGDIMITPSDMNYLGESSPLERYPSYMPYLDSVKGISSIRPVIYRAGIVKSADLIQGVLFKGIEKDSSDTLSNSQDMTVSIPSSLARVLGLETGDELQAYFVGDKVKVRKFKVAEIYESLLEADDKMVVYAGLSTLQRVNGWSENQVSAFEVMTQKERISPEALKELASEVGTITLLYSGETDRSVVCSSSVSNFPQLFDWLDLIDFNVYFILLLMTAVAGFNMISGLLIMLFENIPVIGTLKAIGMQDRHISAVFLSSASVLIFKGMLTGNLLAFAFCIIQGTTHLIPLDPQNYFVSYIPVLLEPVKILAADASAYLVIMLLLLLPCMFISRVDPARTMRMK